MQPPFFTGNIQSPSKIDEYKNYIKKGLLDRFFPELDFSHLATMGKYMYQHTAPLRYWQQPIITQQNHINAYFPVWVLIGIHCENRNTVHFSGSKDGYTSVFLSQHLSSQLLYDVTCKLVQLKGASLILQTLEESGVDLFFKKPLDFTQQRELSAQNKALILYALFDGSFLVNASSEYNRMLMWWWCCTILSVFAPEPIIQILDLVIKSQFTSTAKVAQYFYIGKQLKTQPTFIDRYENELDDSYLEQYPHLNSTLLSRVGRYGLDSVNLVPLANSERLTKQSRNFSSILEAELSRYRVAIANNPFADSF